MIFYGPINDMSTKEVAWNTKRERW